jgi:hypothetical protein
MNQRSDRAILTSLWRLQLIANTVNDCFVQRPSTRVDRFRASAVAFSIVRFPPGAGTAQGRKRQSGPPNRPASSGQLRPLLVAAESSSKPPLTWRPAPCDPAPPPGIQLTCLSRTTYSQRPMAADLACHRCLSLCARRGGSHARARAGGNAHLGDTSRFAGARACSIAASWANYLARRASSPPLQPGRR